LGQIKASIAIVINVNKVPRLHNKRTDWQTYKKLIEDKLNLKMSLKTSEELQKETENFIRILQEAAKQATPPPIIQKVTKNIPLEIEKLIRAKRKARGKWQHSHNPEDKTSYNRLTNR
jgi:translation initiation factor 2B subunit (eIF-2B alpha/beta/delta family)